MKFVASLLLFLLLLVPAFVQAQDQPDTITVIDWDGLTHIINIESIIGVGDTGTAYRYIETKRISGWTTEPLAFAPEKLWREWTNESCEYVFSNGDEVLNCVHYWHMPTMLAFKKLGVPPLMPIEISGIGSDYNFDLVGNTVITDEGETYYLFWPPTFCDIFVVGEGDIAFIDDDTAFDDTTFSMAFSYVNDPDYKLPLHGDCQELTSTSRG